jgi:hypothetical protein
MNQVIFAHIIMQYILIYQFINLLIAVHSVDKMACIQKSSTHYLNDTNNRIRCVEQKPSR